MSTMALEALKADIEAVSSALKESRATSKAAASSLDEFTLRVQALEIDMNPINALSERLLRSQENINKTLEQFDIIDDHFQVFAEVKGILDRSGSGFTPFSNAMAQKQYVKAIDRLGSSIKFVEQHKKLKQAFEYPTMLDLQKKAISNLRDEFQYLIEEHAPKPKAYLSYSKKSNTAASISLPEGISVRLNQLAECIDRNGFGGEYHNVYRAHRSRVLQHVLEEIANVHWPSKRLTEMGSPQDSPSMNSFETASVGTSKEKGFKKFSSLYSTKDSNAEMSTADTIQILKRKASFNAKTLSKRSTNENISDSYIKGEGGVLRLLEVCAYMFQVERKLVSKILPLGDKAKISYLCAMQKPANDLYHYCINVGLVDVVTRFAGNSVADRIFGLADVYACIEGLEAKFDIMLRSSGLLIPTSSSGQEQVDPGKAHKSTSELFTTWKEKAIEQMHQITKNLLADASKLPKDGTVHSVSTGTISFLRRLPAYEKPMAMLSLAAAKAMNSSMMVNYEDLDTYEEQQISCLHEKILEILNELKKRLEQRGKQAAEKSPALAWLFLTNNFHYIYISLSSDKFLSQRLGNEELENRKDYFTQAKKNYVDTITRKMVEILDNQPKIELKNTDRKEPTHRGKNTLKDCMTLVNKWISDIHLTQRKLAVPNPDLRIELRLLVRHKISKKYEAFYNDINLIKLSKKNKEKYVKYAPSRLDAIISQFYEVSEAYSDQQVL